MTKIRRGAAPCRTRDCFDRDTLVPLVPFALEFTCPRCGRPAAVDAEFGTGLGASHLYNEVRVYFAFDAATRTYQYRIIESPAPVADYVSTVQVKETPAGSTVVWSSHFNVKAGTSEADAKKLISGVYRAGLDNLASATAY